MKKMKVSVVDSPQCVKARYILGILGFLGCANLYSMRFTLSVAIVAMVNKTATVHNDENITVLDICPRPDENSTVSTAQPDGPFMWSKTTQGIILGSFFYGYIVTQIPGGRLAELFGGKVVFGIGVLIPAILTLLSPVAASTSLQLFITIRVLTGIAQGGTLPAMQVMLAKWIPPLERSKFSAYVYAGTDFGTVVSLALSGWLCSLEFLGGWPLCFYVFGCSGVIWYIFWLFLIYDTPAKHPRIDTQELKYIEESIEPQDESRSLQIPWVKLLTSLPIYAIMVTKAGLYWASYTRLTELPTYMDNMLHFDIQQNAILSAMPYVSSWCLSILTSIVADWLLAKEYISLLTSYKLFNSLATIIPSLGLVGVAWVGCDRMAAQLLLIIPGAFAGAQYSGNQMNPINLSPKFAGTIFGITNTVANVCGFLAPYAVGALIEGQETLGQWKIVFFLAAGINISANLFYVMFASAEEQPWSKEYREDSNSDEL